MPNTNVTCPPAIYCESDNRYYVREQLITLLSKYLAVMITNGWEPEVHVLEDIDEHNIGHVVYHAEMYRD